MTRAYQNWLAILIATVFTLAGCSDAREAYFVVGSSRAGAMGPTLASFANRNDAEGFTARYGGEVVAFHEVTLEHLTVASTN